MTKYGDLPFGSVPRHRDPSRFGFYNEEGQWVPYEDITEGRLLFACGHTAKVIVANAPGMAEEAVRAFVEKAAAGKCNLCATQQGRLHYQARTGNSTEAKRERD